LGEQTYNRHKNYLAHDEQELCEEGDVVRIESCEPRTKQKTTEVVAVKDEGKWIPLSALRQHYEERFRFYSEQQRQPRPEWQTETRT
jgi:hypothetical protein